MFHESGIIPTYMSIKYHGVAITQLFNNGAIPDIEYYFLSSGLHWVDGVYMFLNVFFVCFIVHLILCNIQVIIDLNCIKAD